MINGTLLEDLNLTNVVTELSQVTRLGGLRFNSISVEHNNTNIQCRATLIIGESVESNNAALLVQGERVVVRSSCYTRVYYHLLTVVLRVFVHRNGG